MQWDKNAALIVIDLQKGIVKVPTAHPATEIVAGGSHYPMRKGEQTRQEIIRRAAPLFNQKGYEGTALSDLMEATGLEKGGIYRYFTGGRNSKQKEWFSSAAAPLATWNAISPTSKTA